MRIDSNTNVNYLVKDPNSKEFKENTEKKKEAYKALIEVLFIYLNKIRAEINNHTQNINKSGKLTASKNKNAQNLTQKQVLVNLISKKPIINNVSTNTSQMEQDENENLNFKLQKFTGFQDEIIKILIILMQTSEYFFPIFQVLNEYSPKFYKIISDANMPVVL